MDETVTGRLLGQCLITVIRDVLPELVDGPALCDLAILPHWKRAANISKVVHSVHYLRGVCALWLLTACLGTYPGWATVTSNKSVSTGEATAVLACLVSVPH